MGINRQTAIKKEEEGENMKILHLGDLHIGKSVNDFSMIEDQEYILDQILDIAGKQEIDAMVIAGDVYDKAIPSEQAVKLLDDFIRKLVENKITTYIISGNHDSDERLNFGSSLFEQSGIYITSKFDTGLAKQVFEDEFGLVNLYLLPFVKASQVKHFFPDEEINSYDDAIRVVLKNAGIQTDQRNVLVAHQFVAGKSQDPILAGSENVAVQNVGTIEKIGVDCFDDFDYVALGHIHSPQRMGRETVRYSGSPLKYSLSEINNIKSVPIITMGEKGEVAVECIELKPKREMRHIKGPLNHILEKQNVMDTDDYIYITLTDDDIVADALGILRQYYPNIMKLDFDNKHTREIEQIDIAKVTSEKSFAELFDDFYTMMYGCEISDEEMAIMNEIAGEVGVGSETN